jgi:hypothetical protein
MNAPRDPSIMRWIGALAAATAVLLAGGSCGSLVETGELSPATDGGHQPSDAATQRSREAATSDARALARKEAAARDTGSGPSVDASTKPPGPDAGAHADAKTDAHDAPPACTANCATGTACTVSSACASGVCTDGTCAAGATLLAGDVTNGMVLRYTVTKTGAPVLSLAIPSPHANAPIVAASGELFVGDFTDGMLMRFLDPYGTPVPNGSIPGLDDPQALVLVDHQLWAASSGSGSIVQLAFGDAGAASVAQTITSGLSEEIRGIAWNGAARVAYVTLCCGTDEIAMFSVAADDSTTALSVYRDTLLDNPNGIVLSPWNELFVANAGQDTILRYTLDDAGAPTANGAVTGNGLSTPVSIAFTPWGEMYVTDQGTNMLSRFAFDSAHTATPNGTFSPAPSIVGGWLYIAP